MVSLLLWKSGGGNNVRTCIPSKTLMKPQSYTVIFCFLPYLCMIPSCSRLVVEFVFHRRKAKIARNRSGDGEEEYVGAPTS